MAEDEYDAAKDNDNIQGVPKKFLIESLNLGTFFWAGWALLDTLGTLEHFEQFGQMCPKTPKVPQSFLQFRINSPASLDLLL